MVKSNHKESNSTRDLSKLRLIASFKPEYIACNFQIIQPKELILLCSLNNQEPTNSYTQKRHICYLHATIDSPISGF